MALITRTAATVTSPFGGGTAWNSFNTSGGSASLGSSGFKGCQWSNFGAPIGGTIISIRLKYDWSWNTEASGSVSDSGSVEASAQASGGVFGGFSGISLTGPGPVSDNDSDGLSGSADVSLPTNTVLSSLATDANIQTAVSSSGSGSGSAGASIQISNIRVEITVQDNVTICGCI